MADSHESWRKEDSHESWNDLQEKSFTLLQHTQDWNTLVVLPSGRPRSGVRPVIFRAGGRRVFEFP